MYYSASLLLVSACTVPAPYDITATVGDIATVVEVTWSTATPADSYVEYGTDDTFGWETPIGEGTTRTQALLGLPPDSPVVFHVVSEVDGFRVVSDDYNLHTGSIPTEIPEVEVTQPSTSTRAWGEYTLASWFDATSSAAVIVNRAGQVVWYQALPSHCMSAAFSIDGAAVIALCGGAEAALVRMPLDGGPNTWLDVPGAHHEFLELPDGRFAVITAEARDVDGVQVIGDRLVEVDTDGTEREVWNAFDHLEVVENAGWSQSPADWTHANGLAYDPERDTFLLSLYRQEQIVGIDATSGATRWTLGEGGDFQFVGDDGFGPQHHPRLQGDDVLLFDNAYDSGRSRVVAYTLDPAALTATRSWSLESPFDAITYVMGDGDRLPGGGTVASWAEHRQLDTFDEAGVVVRTLSIGGTGGAIGNVERSNNLYPVSD